MTFHTARPSLNTRARLTSAGIPFTTAQFRPGMVIFRQGDACDSTMCIEAGTVRLAITSQDGKEAICGLLDTGAFLGEEMLGGYAMRRHTATALTPATLLIVAKNQMHRLLHTENAILDQLLAHLMARHTELEDALVDQILYPGEQRLARALIMLTDHGTEGRRPVPHLSQELIAEMVGMTRSRVNACMGKFKRLGFLEEHDGELLVHPALLGAVRADHHPGSHAHTPG